MIRHFGFTAVAAILLSACTGDTGSQLSADCAILAADPEAQENFADMNADTDSFCACLVALTNAKTPDDQAAISSTLATVTAKMQETGQGAEDVVGPMMSEAMAQPDNEEAQATLQGIQKLGRLIDDIEDAFDAGSCSRGE